LFPHIQIALEISWQECLKCLPDRWQSKAGGPEDVVEAATCTVVHHSDVIEALIHAEIVGSPHYLAREDVSPLLHLHKLRTHQLMLGWITMPLLGLEENWERARHIMGLAIPDEMMVSLAPIPEKGGRTF
jgi:hypothetical protein